MVFHVCICVFPFQNYLTLLFKYLCASPVPHCTCVVSFIRCDLMCLTPSRPPHMTSSGEADAETVSSPTNKWPSSYLSRMFRAALPLRPRMFAPTCRGHMSAHQNQDMKPQGGKWWIATILFSESECVCVCVCVFEFFFIFSSRSMYISSQSRLPWFKRSLLQSAAENRDLFIWLFVTPKMMLLDQTLVT